VSYGALVAGGGHFVAVARSEELRPSRVDTRVAGIGTTITEADEMTSDEQVSCRTDKEGK